MTAPTDAVAQAREALNASFASAMVATFPIRDGAAQKHSQCVDALIAAVRAECADERAELERGARGAIQTAAMMLRKLGGTATFDALEQVAVQGRVTRTDGPMGEFTLTLEAQP